LKVQVLRKKSNSSNFGTRNAFCGPHSSLQPPHNDDDDSSLGSDDEEINYEIVEKFIRTFHNGDYDDEFNDVIMIGVKLYRFGPCRRRIISPIIGEKGIELDWRV
jgi:hypothetical protein